MFRRSRATSSPRWRSSSPPATARLRVNRSCRKKSPAEDPPECIALLKKQTAEIVALPDFKTALDKLRFQPVGGTSAQFADRIKNEIVVWSEVMKDANIPAN
jgi:hypothetical protein